MVFLRGDQVSVRSNGVLLRKTRGTQTWRRAGKFKAEFATEANLKAFVERRLNSQHVRSGEHFWLAGAVRQADLPGTTAHLEQPATVRPGPAGHRYGHLTPSEPEPSMAELRRMYITDTEPVRAIDGCQVEPDGCCEHGKPAWGLYLGFI